MGLRHFKGRARSRPASGAVPGDEGAFAASEDGNAGRAPVADPPSLPSNTDGLTAQERAAWDDVQFRLSRAQLDARWQKAIAERQTHDGPGGTDTSQFPRRGGPETSPGRDGPQSIESTPQHFSWPRPATPSIRRNSDLPRPAPGRVDRPQGWSGPRPVAAPTDLFVTCQTEFGAELLIPFLDDFHEKRLPRRHVIYAVVVASLPVILLGAWLITRSDPVPSDAPHSRAASSDRGRVAAAAIDDSIRRLAVWLRQDVDPTATILASPSLTRMLAGDPRGSAAQRITPVDAAGAGPYDLVITGPRDRDFPGGASGGSLIVSHRPIARFGDFEVRQLIPDGSIATPTADSDRGARAGAGAELLGNRELTFSASSRRPLRGGEADPRLLGLLATLASRHTATVGLRCDPASLPGTPRCRTLDINVIDGLPVASRERVPPLLAQLLPPPGEPSRNSAAMNPRVVLRSTQPRPRLIVTFLAPSPVGLLGDADFPTAE